MNCSSHRTRELHTCLPARGTNGTPEPLVTDSWALAFPSLMFADRHGGVAGLRAGPGLLGLQFAGGYIQRCAGQLEPVRGIGRGIRELRQDLETHNRQGRARALAELERSVSRLRARAGR
jgi:hypothetical protein